jgi:hypothetical protein
MDFNVIDSVINAVFFAQEKTVSGVVSDVRTLPGSNVSIKGSTRGTQTDWGRYSIKTGE